MSPIDSTPLDDTREFLAECVYARPEKLDAIALLIAASHACDAFMTVPRLLVVSDARALQAGFQTGKTTVLDMVLMLAGNTLDASGTQPGLSAAFINNVNKPSLTIVRDEIHHVFGRNGLGGNSHPLYDPLVRGYRRNATHLFSSGHNASLVSIYGVAAMAGLGNAVPGDLRSRCVVISMDPKPESMQLRPTGAEDTLVLGRSYHESLHAWVRANFGFIKTWARNTPGFRLHPKLGNRREEIWKSLFAVAAAAGGTWPVRCLIAFETLALDASDRPVLTPRQQVMLDMGAVFRAYPGVSYLTVSQLHDGLLKLPHAGELYDNLSNKAICDLMARAAGQQSDVKWTGKKAARVRYREDIMPVVEALEAKLFPEPDEGEHVPEDWEYELGIFALPEAVEETERPADSATAAQGRLDALLGRKA